jgi:hypothetical protein
MPLNHQKALPHPSLRATFSRREKDKQADRGALKGALKTPGQDGPKLVNDTRFAAA